MGPYGKTSQTAIAAVSRLAEVYDPNNEILLSSIQIAESRDLPHPVVGKVLTILSQGNIITGARGPGGGYKLAKSPNKTTLFDVVVLFDRLDGNVNCPFGPGYCGNGPRCPLHDKLTLLREQSIAFLKQNTFASFQQVAS
jgi:Rrf2 family transcriptional regulator, iron-sulfur cluster assembly transcription factor